MSSGRFSRFLLEHRAPFAVAYLVITALFAWSLGRLQVATVFSDLFPYTHPYVQTFGLYGPVFGSPLGVVLAVESTDGDVFETATLEKIRRITDALDRIPGVNHNQVVSLTSPRVKRMEMRDNLIEVAALVGGEIPKTAEELRELKRRAMTTEGVMGILVSPDSRATMISANFFESEIDYDLVFRRVAEIVERERDARHRLHAAGQPLLTGWIYHHYRETSWLFAASLASMVCLLALYFRNVAGVVTPLVVGVVSAVWGFGLVALLGYNLDPLIIVVPVLLVARALSHSVQMCERYFELYCESGDVKEAAAKALDSLFSPGAVGIFTDAMGLFVIMIAPIGVVQKLGLVCGLWALGLLASVVLLSPLVVSVLPAPRNARSVVLRSAADDPKLLARFFDGLSFLSATRARAAATIAVFLLGAVACGWWASKREVGNVGAGSPLLWADSFYNRSIHAINERFVGSDQLHVIVEGAREDAIKQPAVLRSAIEFQAYMEASPAVTATLSVADMIGMGARYLNGGFPKWEAIPDDRAWTGSMFQ
ncbi:MAG: efflux RND transporter permease subunit, partial [Candidatus Binatia bacterium]